MFNLKNMFKFSKLGWWLLGLVVSLGFLGSVALASPTGPGGSSPTTPGAFCLDDSDTWKLCDSTFTFGDSSAAIADANFTAATIGTLTLSGATLFADGTALLPSIAFSADTNTGIYRSAADTLGFTGNGVSLGTWTAGNLALNAGHVTWSAGVAVTAGNYSIGRDADATNQLHFNVPTGATTEWSINDVAFYTINNLGRITHSNVGIASGTAGQTFTYSTTGATAGTGLSVNLLAGGASPALYSGGNFDNAVAGTGTAYITDGTYGMRFAAGNLGINAFSRATTIGTNAGGEYLARGGNTNVGIWAAATITKVSGITTANSVNAGVVGLGVPEAIIESGTTTSTTASKLVEAGQNFTATMTSVGYKVRNITTGATAVVTAVDSATQLSLSADIMVSGQAYRIVNGATFGGWFGLYNQSTMPYGLSAALVADNGGAAADVFDARTNGVSSFRINSSGGIIEETTTPGAYPYTLTVGDRYVYVDTDGGARTINLPAIAGVDNGFRVMILDDDGNAQTSPITIDGNASETINESGTFTINTNFGSASLQKRSDGWHIF